MAAGGGDVPRYAYPLAVAGGLCSSWFSLLLAGFVTHALDRGGRDLSFVGAVTFAAAHLVIGGVFGLWWPEKTWRWGVWLCLVPVCFASLLEPDAYIFCWVVALTLAPACAGAYAAARVHLKHVEAE